MEHLTASMALASVTASTVSSSSSPSSTAPSSSSTKSSTVPPAQNWRGKYLRALNISTPEVDVTRKRAPLGGGSSVSSTSSFSQHQQLLRRARSCRTMNTPRDAGDSAMRSVRSRRQLLLQRQSGADYGFAVRPDLARGRRCHTDPVVAADEKVSAPIQIPSASPSAPTFSGGAKLSDITNLEKSATTSERSNRRYGYQSPGENCSGQQGKLLSWEDPVAMMAAVPTVVTTLKAGPRMGGFDLALSQRHASDHKSEGDFFCDEFVEEPEDDDVEHSDSGEDDAADDDDDDPIFEMEDFENNDSSNNDDANRSRAKSSRSRRLRTASVSLATVTSPSSRAAALPRFHSVRHMRCPPSDVAELPASFVPPHQLVQRDVFSIGLRDRFKRRPAKI